MWKLDAARGTLELPDFSAALDLTRPDRGLEITALRDANQTAPLRDLRILQVNFPERPAADDVQDSWVRGSDLVVTYGQRKARQVTAEIYWRAVQCCANAFGMELILSVQTELLDATPTASAASQIQCEQVLWLSDPRNSDSPRPLDLATSSLQVDRDAGQGIFVFRLAQCPVSYVEMVHPTDFSSATLRRQNDQTLVAWQLFPESLEKGVIRRGRLRGIFVDRQNDLSLAAQCFQEFVISALPLTT